jgi:hypothetical protein
MKYQAVIVNFDRKTVEYVSADKMPKPKKALVAVASGSTPPPSQTALAGREEPPLMRWRITLAAIGAVLGFMAAAPGWATGDELLRRFVFAAWWGLLLGLVGWWLDRRSARRSVQP